jgi:hypothetical protein
MANPNPVRARIAKRKRTHGDMQDLAEVVWQAVQKAHDNLSYTKASQEKCAALHAMSSIATIHTKIYQVGEYETRLALVERILEELRRA